MQITCDILDTILQGNTKPTRIMYGANLSWKPLQKLLAGLVAGGFIDKTNISDMSDKRTRVKYGVTAKGNTWLQGYRELMSEL